MEVLFTRTTAATLIGRLRIHAETARSAEATRGTFASITRWTEVDPDDLPLLSLQVQDARGRSVYVSHDSHPRTDVALAPGLYRVTARCGEVERQFAISLGARERVDMHLHLAEHEAVL